MLKSYKIYTCTNGSLGLHLSRAPWDPYPWVSSIQKDSTSYQAGLRIGDCLLELNGQDVLGMKISEIAALLKNHWLNESSNYVTVVIWRNKCSSNNNSETATTNNCNESFNADDDDDDDDDDGGDDYGDEDEENNAHNINQQSLQKFATCLQHIAQLLECPVCLEVIKPPGWQCCNGHVLCNNCRSRSEKCPVCRVPLGPRGRCLLSDKLFTLLADSFPCDGVRSNKNSPKDRRKCSTEFHSQPMMAIAQKHPLQQQQEKDEQHGVKKAKDFLLTSLRRHSRKLSHYKTNHDDNMGQGLAGETKGENKHPSIQKQTMYNNGAGVIVRSSSKRNSSHRKSSTECNSEAASIIEQQANNANSKSVATTFCYNELQGQISTIQQCHCITCFKSDGVAIVNNLTTAAALTTTATAATTTQSPAVNKYILRIPSQGQLGENIVQQQQRNEEKYQNYQCPTGKLCCLNVNVMPHATCTRTSRGTFIVTYNNNETSTNTPFREPMTNNNLSERTATTTTTQTTKSAKQTNVKLTQTALMTGQQHQLQNHQLNTFKFYKILKNEWDILAHLTEDHKLPVNQYYAEYGQRIVVHSLNQQQSITCLNLKGADENDAKVEKFFIACIPVEQPTAVATKTTSSKVAIFLYHINTLANDATTITATTTTGMNDEASSFETIIENPLTGIKWFGRAHPLTLTWSQIYEKQHFLWHSVLLPNSLAVRMNEGTLNTSDDDAAFVIVVKRNSEIKTRN